MHPLGLGFGDTISTRYLVLGPGLQRGLKTKLSRKLGVALPPRDIWCQLSLPSVPCVDQRPAGSAPIAITNLPPFASLA
jgi:hypothetical protein